MLKRKMLRDMKRHKTQFISIFVMAFLAVFIYSGIGGEWRGLMHNSSSFYIQTNLADVFVMGRSFSQEQEDAVGAIGSVTAVERRSIIDAVMAHAPGLTSESEAKLSLHFVEKNEISSMLLVEGSSFDAGDADGIWISKRFADANGLQIGDILTLSLLGIECEKEIRGTIHSPEYVFMQENGSTIPNFEKQGYAYLSWTAFPEPGLFYYTELLLKADELYGLEEKVNDVLDGHYAVYLEQENHPSVALFQNEILQHKMMGDVFPLVFLLVALLTMMTTMTRIVNNQRIQIGTLKAMGFRRDVILRHYTSYGFWLALFGSIFGCITGPLTLPKLFYPSISVFYTLPAWNSVFHISFAAAALAVILLCTFITYMACVRQLMDTPAQTLRPKVPAISRHSFIEKTLLWSKLGFNAQWNLRDAARNKTRSAMAVIGVLGCTALLACAFGMNDSMNILEHWQYEDIYRFDIKLSIEETAGDEQIQNVVNAVNGQALMESSIELRVSGVKKTGTVTVTDCVTLLQPTDYDRRPMTLPADGISMTSKMAQSLGVSPGDAVEWHVYGSETWVTSKIDVLYREPSTQGLAMTREVFEELGYTYRPTAILTAEKTNDSYDGISAVLSTSDLIDAWNSFTEAMMIMVYVLIVGAAVLAIVVLYNLGLLSFTEMERDMATLKVMGLKTKKLRRLLLTQNLCFSAAGYLLGLPCGVWLVRTMVDASGDSFDFPVVLTASTSAAAFIITFGLSISVSLMFSKKIRCLNMVESLKAIE